MKHKLHHILSSGLFTLINLTLFLGTSLNTFGQTSGVPITTSTNWTAPAGVTSVTVECWGAGGGGSGGNIKNKGNGGGGGGAYATAVITVISGNTYNVTVGAGGAAGTNGAGSAGGNTSFNTSSVIAIGGSPGTSSQGASPGSGGSGGLNSACTPTLNAFSGGNGGNGDSATDSNGGGGGGSAGNGIDGGNGGTPTAGTAPSDGGVGGLGGTNSIGLPGTAPGGGGGGSGEKNDGGAGADGQVILTWTVSNDPTITLGTFPAVCEGITSANLPYSATSNSPDQYSIDYIDASFTDVVNATLNAAPSNIPITIPGGTTAGVYDATLTVTNSGTSATSAPYPFTVTVNALPNLIISDPAAVCSPATVDLTAAAVTAGSDAGTLTYWTDTGATSTLGTPAAVTISGIYYIKLTDGNGCEIIQPVTATINPQPNLIISDPAAVCSPATVDLTAAAVTAGSDAGTLTYWTDAGATSTLGTPAAVTISGIYYIKLTDGNGCEIIQPVTATINPQPNLIISDPAAVCSPATVDLTAAAVTAGSDAGTLTYWTDAGATSTLGTPAAVTISGTYYIKLTDGNGCETIQPVTVTINPLPNLIISDPAAVCSPATVDLTAAAVTAGSDAGTLTYWTDAGATSTLGTPAAVTISGTYYIKLTDGNGCETIQPVTATINPLPNLIISDPAAVCSPATVDLTAAAVTAGSDAGTLTYWTDAGATSTLGTPAAVTTSGTYYIKLTDGNGCETIQPVTAIVNDVPALPVISGPTTVVEGNNYFYTIDLVGDATNYTWAWPGNPGAWTYVSGQGTTSLEVTAGSQGGDITVFVTNSCGDGPTATLAVVIGVLPNCPESTSIAPTGTQTLCEGDSSTQLIATVTNTTGGSGTPTHLYQWYYNTTNSNSIGTATLLSGATSQTYTPLTSASEIGDRWYFCVGYATDNGCAQTNADQSLASTNTVQVSVSGTPTTATTGSPQTICNGASSASLGANTPTVGTGAWSVTSGPSTSNTQFANTAVPGTTFTPSGGAGSYVLRWTISNAPCTESTAEVTITVNEQPTPAVSGGPQTICDGSAATLGANTPTVGTGAWAVFSGPSTSSAQFANTAVPGTNFTPAGGAGSYVLRWTISNSPCTPSTSDVTITVKDVPALPVISGASTVTVGNPEIYSITPVGDATNYTWTVPGDWTNFTGQGTASITVTPQSAGDITVYVTNSCGDGPTAIKSVTLGVSANCPESTSIAPAGTQTLCQGDASNQLTATITNSGGTGTPSPLYQWYYNTTNSNDPSGATSVGTSSTYTPPTTVAEVRWYFCVGYAIDNGCSQSNSDQTLASSTVQITVNALPTAAVITGLSEVCIGSNITLTEGTSGTIVWNSSNTGVATINSSGLVTPVTTGTTNITYTVTDGNSCTSASSPVHEVTVIDTPVTPTITGLSSVPPFAAGYQYSISADPTATLYSWSFPPNWVITSGTNSNVITVTTGGINDDGNITVTVTNPCGTSPQDTFAVAVDPATNHTDYNCTSCHITHNAPGSNLTNVFGNALLCQSCHITNGAATSKPLVNANNIALNPGTGNSHAWDVDGENLDYETNLPTNNDMLIRMPEDPPTTGPKQLICSTCHNQHNNGNAGSPYLRVDNTADAMCKDCHSARDVGLYSDAPATNKGSHPVGVTYDDTDTRFNNTQTLITNGSMVQCSTCHGVHDVDNSLGLAANGNLLKATNDVSLCTDCHNYGTHNGMTCLDCHEVHNSVDGTIDNNIYMIKGSISTPLNGNKPVEFTNRGGNTGSYAGTVDGSYTGVCEVCHDSSYNIAHFNNDGLGSDQLHTSQPGNIPEANCTTCHPHSSNFSPSGGDCVSCHQDNTTYPYLTGNWQISDGHVAHTTKYSFDCSTCHFNRGSGSNPDTHIDGTVDFNFNPTGLAKRNGQDTNTPSWNGTTCSSIYCHSNGMTAERGTDATHNWADGTTTPTVPFNNGTLTYATIDWTGSITACTACHGGPDALPLGPIYDITAGGAYDSNSVAEMPNTGSHGPFQAQHDSGNEANWGGGTTQCFWCHDTDDRTAAGGVKKQGTYGTSFHVDGETHFKMGYTTQGGTGNVSIPRMEVTAGHCQSKECWGGK